MSMTKCPMCGYTDAPTNTHKSNAMNLYVNAKTGEEVTMNSAEEKHVIGGVEHVRKDLHKPKAVEAPKVPVVPAAKPSSPMPTTPTAK